MNNYNSKHEIKKWMYKVLNDGIERKAITEEDYYRLCLIGTTLVRQNKWRGNISEAWKKLGFGSDKLNDLYL